MPFAVDTLDDDVFNPANLPPLLLLPLIIPLCPATVDGGRNMSSRFFIKEDESSDDADGVDVDDTAADREDMDLTGV